MQKIQSQSLFRASLFAAALIFQPSGSWAWSSSATTVTSVGAYADGHVYVRFGGWSGNNGCGTDQFSLGLAGAPQQRAMQAIALTALATGKTVGVETAPGVCNGQQEIMTSLMVNQ